VLPVYPATNPVIAPRSVEFSGSSTRTRNEASKFWNSRLTMDRRLTCAIDVASVVDPQHRHGSSHVIDSIQDSICSASCTKDASEFSAQLPADTVRVFNKGTSYEIENGRSNVCWKNVAY
jgi:hypothetical protein